MAGHRWIGYLVWIVLFAAVFAWEGIGLLRVGDAYPTLSDAVRVVMRSAVGRWALFALWLWFGWHAFVRGWHFLLRGPEGGGEAGPRPAPTGGPGSLMRHDVLPMLIGYALVMGTLAAGWRVRHRTTAHRGQEPDENGTRTAAPGQGWPALIRKVIGTAAGGYLVLMAVVVTYYYAVAGESGHFLASALTGAALLIGLAVPVFLLTSWSVQQWHGRRERAGESSCAPTPPWPPAGSVRPRPPGGRRPGRRTRPRAKPPAGPPA